MLTIGPDGTPSLPRCVSEICRLPLRPEWAFCPFCGKDNRPPERQKRVRRCRHVWPPDGYYCVNCGVVSPKYHILWDDVLTWASGAGVVIGLLIAGFGKLVERAYLGHPFLFIQRETVLMKGQSVLTGSAQVEVSNYYQIGLGIAVVCFAILIREWLPDFRWWRWTE
jgi:hypothetical protein